MSRSPLRRLSKACASLFVATLTFASAGEALAGGFEIPDHGARALGRGGAYAVGVKDLTAAHYNPAAMAKFRGTRLMISHNSLRSDMTYTRAPLGPGWVDGAGNSLEGTAFGPVSSSKPWFLLGGFGAVSSDFGLENATFYAAVHGPSANGHHEYPAYGSQSFMLTEMSVVTMFFHLGGAWKYKSKTSGKDLFGIGGSLAYAILPSMRYGLVTDSSSRTGIDVENFNPIPDPESTQLETVLSLKDNTGISGNVGMWLRPIDAIEIGLSGRVIPTIFRPTGTLEVDKDTLVTDEVKASMKKITMPVMLRGGLRYIHMKGERELFDIELNAVWENWSQIRSYDLDFDGRVAGQQLLPISLDKSWRDAFSVRAGGDYNVIEDHLWVRAGGFWERGAVQDVYAHLDFPSFNRWGLSAGLTAGLPGAEFSIGYQHIFQADVTVTEANSRVYQQRPLRPCPEFCMDEASGLATNGVPANAGLFESAFDMIGISVDLNFTTLIKNRKAKREASAASAAKSSTGAATPSGG